ncbi:hypothetical protein CSOJ01_15888 [Colletotrichum sojae]|uniref:Uncharacterized protein n=1 Tax=Colletotrichum sojae TaxID=2175907 RepID=A0A8H6MHY7_9PEZI|nr:hypothetical protein CSOJ01_15888 [Colletotrichum sojae]
MASTSANTSTAGSGTPAGSSQSNVPVQRARPAEGSSLDDTAAQLARAKQLQEARQSIDQASLSYNAVVTLTRNMNFELWEHNLKAAFKVLGLLVYLISDGIPLGYQKETVFSIDETLLLEDPTYSGDPELQQLVLAKSLIQKKIDYKLMEEMVDDGLSINATAYDILNKVRDATQKFNKLAIGKVYDDWNRMTRTDYGNTKDFVNDLYMKFNKLNGSGMGITNKALAYRLIWGFRRFDQAKADSMENDFVMGIRTHEDLLRELKGLGEKEEHEQASQSVGSSNRNRQTPSQHQRRQRTAHTDWISCTDCNAKHPEGIHKCNKCACYHKKTSSCPAQCDKCPFKHFKGCNTRYNRFEYISQHPPQQQTSAKQTSSSVFASGGLKQDSVFGNTALRDLQGLKMTNAYKEALRAEVGRRTLPIFHIDGDNVRINGLHPDAHTSQGETSLVMREDGLRPDDGIQQDSHFAMIAIEDEDDDGTGIQNAHLDRYVMSTSSLRRTDSFMLDSGASRHILNDLSVFDELRDLPQGLSMNCVGRKDHIGSAVGSARIIATKPNGMKTTF